MSVSIAPSPFGSLSVSVAETGSTLDVAILATANSSLDIGVGIPGPGVPAGGTTGQVLKKLSATDYDTAWQTDLNTGVWGSITGTLSNQTDLQTALDLKAPLASPGLTGVPTAPTAATTTSTTQIATTAFVQQELASGVAVAKNLEVYVRNQTGSTLAAGTIVYINGATGNRPTITKAQANNDSNSAQTFGFVKESIANNGFGYVITRGEVGGLDTSALTEGQQLYLSPTTAGTWTTTKPYAPEHLVYVGIVLRSHPNQGTILVAIQNGYELDEIHDVAITSKTNNDLLAYESSSSLWKNKSFSTLGLLTSATAASTYQTISGMSSYLTTASAASTYLTQANAASTYQTQAGMSSYLTTASAASTYQTISGMSSYAPLASPTFTGTPAAPTASADTNTTQVATTAYVIGQGYLKSATASSTYAPLASPALTGTPTAPTAATSTNTTQIATTAFVLGQGNSTAATIAMNGTQAAGTSNLYARADHVHPTDTSRAPLASPALTGTPTAPTASAGTNTTQIATTAFVTAAVPAFATNAETIIGTSTTAALAPTNIGAILSHPELRSLAFIKSTAVQGSGAVTTGTLDYGSREMYLSSLATGRACWQYGIPGANANMMSRADWRKLDFSKKIWMAGKAMCGTTTGFGSDYKGDTNTYTRITLGGYSGNATGDMTLMGIGWKKQGGYSPYFTLTVHNGTTLTDVATSVQQSDNKCIDWLIYSDGAGNVTLYIDGAQAATTSAGPTGITNAYNNAYREQVEATTTPGIRQVLESTGGWIYIQG